MCVLMSLQDWLFQTQLAASRHDGHLVLHVETHQVTDTQKHLIAGPHLVTQTVRIYKLKPAAVLRSTCMRVLNPALQLYLSVWIDQQQVAHGGSLHTTEDILTRGGAALPDQEIPAAGEERLCLLSPQPAMKDTERGTDMSRLTH